eukprot:1158145-Pelagomonas_calceolata.AAC.1
MVQVQAAPGQARSLGILLCQGDCALQMGASTFTGGIGQPLPWHSIHQPIMAPADNHDISSIHSCPLIRPDQSTSYVSTHYATSFVLTRVPHMFPLIMPPHLFRPEHLIRFH